MPSKKITDFELTSAVGSSFAPVSSSDGSVTNKVTLQSIADLAPSDTFWNLFLPPAPTNLSVAAGNAQVSLTWSAPSVISTAPIIDYIVQYSSNSGSTWTTFSDSVSSSTSATVTGLTNGTSYVFRVAAVNGVGTGSYTNQSSSIIPGGDPYFGLVTLLLHGNGNVTDSSSFNHSITSYGNVNTSAGSKFGSGSIGLGGTTSDYLSIPSEAATFVGDFVVEFWIYPETDANTAQEWCVLQNEGIFLLSAGGGMSVWKNGYQLAAGNGTPVTPGQWHHIAYVRSADTMRGYIDGILVGTTSSTETIGGNNSMIGLRTAFDNYGFKGRFDEYRITTGSDRGYTGSTIPVPTAPFDNMSTVTPLSADTDQYFSNVVLLLQADGNFNDSSSYAHTVNRYGNININSISKAKFGSGSIGLNGGYLTIPSEAATFTGDFVIETWIYIDPDASSGPWSILENQALINLFSNGTMEIYMNGYLMSINVGSVSREQWHHIAFVRSGSIIRGYFNGELKGTGSGSQTIGSGSNRIGLKTTYGTSAFKGRLDDYRITIGSDRGYTGSTIPLPTSSLPNH